jgi:hypothetical protein
VRRTAANDNGDGRLRARDNHSVSAMLLMAFHPWVIPAHCAFCVIRNAACALSGNSDPHCDESRVVRSKLPEVLLKTALSKCEKGADHLGRFPQSRHVFCFVIMRVHFSVPFSGELKIENGARGLSVSALVAALSVAELERVPLTQHNPVSSTR